MRRAARRGRLWGYARQSDAKLRFAGLGRHRRHRRRAERHGYQSLTARQSRDLLLISGRVGCTNTLAPLASPPKHPLREVFSFLGVARARVLCCGSFPHSLRSLRRSPSATRKCQSTLSLRAKAASVNNHRHVWWLKKVLYPSSAATRFAMRFHLLTHLNNR